MSVVRHLLVGALILIVASPSVHAQVPPSSSARLERAWSSWFFPEGAKLVAEGLRITTTTEADTLGRVSRKTCGHQICIGSSVVRVIDSDAFELDPSLSEASLHFGFLGLTQTAQWESEDLDIPRVRPNAGDTTVGRDAFAAGEIYGVEASSDQLRRARLVAGVSIGPLAPPDPDPDPVPSSLFATPRTLDLRCWNPRRAERAFARAHNRNRRGEGLSRLRLDADLSRVARAHTRDMVAQDSLHHSTALQLRRRISGWTILGENVGVGGTPNSLMQAFLDSPGHRANILHAGFRYFGVGTKRSDGRLWVTVIFEALEDPSTSLRMPRC